MNSNKQKKKTGTLWIFLLLFIFFSSISYYYFTNNKPQNNAPEESSQLPTQSNSKYVTDKTEVATSLDIPPLYPYTHWTNITEKSRKKQTGLDLVMAVDEAYNFTEIPLKGTYWYTETPDAYSLSIYKYYRDILKKNGWAISGGKIKFDSFSLQGIAADGPCGGGVGFIGYKNGIVRVVSLGHDTIPCLPPNTKHSTGYTLFISNPTTLEEIVTSSLPQHPQLSPHQK